MRYLIFSLFAMLLAGAVVFAQERFLFCDAAYIFTQILNHNALELYGEPGYIKPAKEAPYFKIGIPR